ncbi:hypothetical protein D3C83_07220 [compost metagenome]
MEGAGARVARLAARQRHLEEAVAFDREVERAAGAAHVAGGEVPRRRHRARAEAGLEADGRLAFLRRRRARRLDLLVDQVLELDAALLEAGRVHVREVVRDVVDVGLLRVHPARRRIKRSNHLLPLCRSNVERLGDSMSFELRSSQCSVRVLPSLQGSVSGSALGLRIRRTPNRT